jgi:hypothetical protein
MSRGSRIQLNPSTKDPMIALDKSHTDLPMHTSYKTTISHSTSTGGSETNVTNVLHSLRVKINIGLQGKGERVKVRQLVHIEEGIRTILPPGNQLAAAQHEYTRLTFHTIMITRSML